MAVAEDVVFGPIPFDVNCTKLKWTPKTIDEIVQVMRRTFESPVSLEEVEPIIGTDHVKKWAIRKEEDIGEFMKAPSMMNEFFAEKVFQFRTPDRFVPRIFEPKKMKILAKGRRLCKFFGEDAVSTRNVEISLKLFDCGHFYMKQTLPGSGASPYWVIYEGTWERTDKGFLLDYLLRYSWQKNQTPKLEFSIEGMIRDFAGTLAWSGEVPETQLNGFVPAIVGEERFCWIEICREPDKVEDTKARFNEDCPDPPSWTDTFTTKEQDTPSDGSGLRQRKSAAASTGSASACKVETPAKKTQPRGPAFSPAPPVSPHPSYDASASSKFGEKPATGMDSSTNIPFVDEEPIWPLYMGLSVFVPMVAYFWWNRWGAAMIQSLV